MKSTKIVRTQSSTMDQSRPRLHQLVKTNQKCLNGPKSTKIVPVSQNEPKVTQDLPKLTGLTNIVRT